MLKDQGAQEYAANQTREEARHVTAFARYIKARWGDEYVANIGTISRLRTKLGEDPKNPRLIKTIYGAGYIFLSEVGWG